MRGRKCFGLFPGTSPFLSVSRCQKYDIINSNLINSLFLGGTKGNQAAEEGHWSSCAKHRRNEAKQGGRGTRHWAYVRPLDPAVLLFLPLRKETKWESRTGRTIFFKEDFFADCERRQAALMFLQWEHKPSMSPGRQCTHCANQPHKRCDICNNACWKFAQKNVLFNKVPDGHRGKLVFLCQGLFDGGGEQSWASFLYLSFSCRVIILITEGQDSDEIALQVLHLLHATPDSDRMKSSWNCSAPPTCLASVLLLQLLSHPLTGLKKKDMSTCLLWMSLWPHISAHPQLSDRRQRRAIRPSHAEPHLHSLDKPSSLHSMAELQVFQAKMLANEEASLDSASLRDLMSTTDLALRATKATAQAIGRSMSSRAVVINLLEKGAIENIPPAQSKSGFYSPYFLVPKKEGGLRPILDFRLLNYALMKRSFRMITLKQIQICPGDWFKLLDLKDAYFHIQVAPHHRRFFRFAFEGYINTRSCRLGYSWLPALYMMHECGSLPSATDGNPYTQLPRRLARSGPVAGGFNIAQGPPPQPLRFPGAQGQLCQEHTVTQPMSFVPGHSYQLKWQQLSQRSEPRQFSTTRPLSRKVQPVHSKVSRECWALWQRLRRYFSWVCFTCDPSSSGWNRGFHPWLGITDATA